MTTAEPIDTQLRPAQTRRKELEFMTYKIESTLGSFELISFGVVIQQKLTDDSPWAYLK